MTKQCTDCREDMVRAMVKEAAFCVVDHWQCPNGHHERAYIASVMLKGSFANRALEIDGRMSFDGEMVAPGVWINVDDGTIVVAGGANRHTLFSSLAELDQRPEIDVEEDVLNRLRRYRL